MLEGVQKVLGRIGQIESRIQGVASAPEAPFSQYLQQAQATTAGANFNPAGMGLSGLPNQQSFIQSLNPSAWSGVNPAGSMPPVAGAVSGEALEKTAASQDGKQYWPNACAHAVNDCLKQMGIDIKDKVNNNPEWVPNYADLGSKVQTVGDMKPGDLVIYNNYLGQGGYDHIGIYAGNGEAWNVSTAAGYKWVKTPIGSRFQEGRRITAQ